MGKMQNGEKAVAVIGDSTFIHTGINGLISAAYNGAKGVVVIMDNAITAMTGGQQNPGTGVTLQGKETRRVSIEKLCEAAGADQVDVLNPYEMDGFQSLLKTRLAEDKLSVIIVRAPCKMVDRSRNAVFEIDGQKCKKCRQCLMLDCPAILEGADGMITINEALCVGCGLCKQVCKFDAISLKKKQGRG